MFLHCCCWDNVSSFHPFLHTPISTCLQEIPDISQNKHDNCASAFRQASKGHPLTFNQLMQRRRAPDDKADYVYMVIRQLSSTQEFVCRFILLA